VIFKYIFIEMDDTSETHHGPNPSPFSFSRNPL
jgi:hypothetical protein